MNRLFSIVCIFALALVMVNCKKDDNGDGNKYVPIRPLKEVYTENLKSIEEYLDNNYMIENDGTITFDSITSPNYKKEPVISKDARLKSINVSNEDYALMAFSDPKNPYAPAKYKYLKSADTIKYKIYYLILNEGQGKKVSPIDSIYMKRTTTTLKNKVFNTANNPKIGGYYSFPPTIAEYTRAVNAPLRTNTGDRQMMQLIKTATGIGEAGDGLPMYDKNSAGRIIAFIPSGLGLYNNADNGLAGYKAYITDITLINNKERDHDRDGIPSKYEVENIKPVDQLTIHDYFSFDTDGDGIPNFLDIDDDGDSVSTKDELSYKNDRGEIKYYEYNAPELKTCSGTPRYLDGSCFPDRKDNEWVWPIKK